MTIPATPLPGIGALLQATVASPSTGRAWHPGSDGPYTAQVFRRGSYALAAGVEAVRRSKGAQTATVWFPGYFCNEALDPLRQMSVSIKFYPVLSDLTPDWLAVRSQIGDDPGAQVLVLVHYFGFPNATGQAQDFCQQNDMVLLEDAAHVLRPGGDIGQADLLVFSPRKLLAVPSGGVLIASDQWAAHLPESEPVQSRNGETLRWLAKRFAQQVFVRLNVPWHRFRPDGNDVTLNGVVDYSDHPALEKCGTFNLKMLTVMSRSLEQAAQRRRSNYQRLLGWVEQLSTARPLFDHLPAGVCPYAFPLLVDEGTADVAAQLNAQGIPASRWPDLPPEVLDQPVEYRTSIETFERLVLLPLHQSLSVKQMDLVGEKLRQTLSGRHQVAERI